jgi:hypothetical protein
MIDLDDDGFIPVKINGVEKRLDLYLVNNRLYELGRQKAGKPDHEYIAGVVELLAELGFPDCSHRLADRFVVGVNETLASLKNVSGGGPKPGSPDFIPASSEHPLPPPTA